MIRRPFVVLLLVMLAAVGCQSDIGQDSSSLGSVVSPANASLPNVPVRGSGDVGDARAVVKTEAGTALLDKTDRSELARAEARAFTAPLGQKVTWKNPSSGHSGTMTPVRDAYAADGAYCRDFKETFAIDNKSRTVHTRACQQPNGAWRTVSSSNQ